MTNWMQRSRSTQWAPCVSTPHSQVSICFSTLAKHGGTSPSLVLPLVDNDIFLGQNLTAYPENSVPHMRIGNEVTLISTGGRMAHL